MLAKYLLFFTLAAVSVALFAAEDSGIAGVVDGDGLVINGKEHRLFGIDSVELDQGCIDSDRRIWACGQEAKKYLESLVSTRRITCVWTNKDRYRRRLSVCSIGGVDVNAAIVRVGYAVAYTKYSDKYLEQEGKAQRDRKGIWAGEFLMPWDHRSHGLKLEIIAPDASKKIKGNINRKGRRLYHCPSDKSYKNTKITEAKGEMWFATPEEAEHAGWTRASNFGACKF